MANTYKIRPLEKKHCRLELRDLLSLSCMVNIGDLAPNYRMMISTDNYASIGPIVSSLEDAANYIGITLADKNQKRLKEVKHHQQYGKMQDTLECINQRNFDNSLNDFHYDNDDDDENYCY